MTDQATDNYLTTGDELDALPTLQFMAASLSPAWRNVATAASSNSDRPMLNHTVLVEFHQTGALLVSTDSYMMLCSWVPTVVDELTATRPGFDEVPLGRVLVNDTDKSVADLMKRAAKDAAAADKAGLPSPEITVGIGSIEAPELVLFAAGQPSLNVIYENHVVDAPLFDSTSYPDWRRLLASLDAERQAGDGVAIQIGLLKRLGGLVGIEYPLDLASTGTDSAVLVDVSPNDEHDLFGAVMPSMVSGEGRRPWLPGVEPFLTGDGEEGEDEGYGEGDPF